MERVRRVSWPHLGLGLIGLAVSSYAFVLHLRVKAGGSACGVSETINCDKVLTSRYGEIFGIPLGLYGAVFFLIVLTTAITTEPPERARSVALQRLLIAGVGFASSMLLTFISWTQLHALCLVCLATHATTLTLFIVSLYGYWKMNHRGTEAQRKENL
jgi:uncharacterized membrane protein